MSIPENFAIIRDTLNSFTILYIRNSLFFNTCIIFSKQITTIGISIIRMPKVIEYLYKYMFKAFLRQIDWLRIAIFAEKLLTLQLFSLFS